MPSDKRLPALLWRRKAGRARFIAVLSPSHRAWTLQRRWSRCRCAMRNGDAIPGAAAVRLVRGLTVETVVWNPDGANVPVRRGGIRRTWHENHRLR